MSWRNLLLLGVALRLIGCNGVLGIEERQLDVARLSAAGYEGCVPSRGECSVCTSAWHTCICEGWGDKAQAVLRRDCASMAPESIRSTEVSAAETAYEAFLAEEDAGAGDDGKPGFNEDFCSSDLEADACLGCFCVECVGPIDDCLADTDCPAIMQCMLDSDCDPFRETGSDACYNDNYCKKVIDEGGGLNSRGYELFLDTMHCAAGGKCPCNSPANDCRPGGDCSACDDCWLRCQCEGKDQGQCQRECGSEDCTPASDCALDLCQDCVDECLCRGDGDLGGCIQICLGPGGGPDCHPDAECKCEDCLNECTCQGRPLAECQLQCKDPNCNQESNCQLCATCFEQCICNGNSLAKCQSDCPTATQCNAGAGACASCSTCISRCNCEGRPFWQCLDECDYIDCTDTDCASCESPQASCECSGTNPDDCLADGVTPDCRMTFATECTQCACERCPSQLAVCEEVIGCPALMDCMQRTGCYDGASCNQAATCRAEVTGIGGIESHGMGIAESLNNCRLESGCVCNPGMGPNPEPPPDIVCGNTNCTPFIPPPPERIAPACCPPGDGMVGDSCGIDMAAFEGTEPVCVPYVSPGTLSDECPEHQPRASPWGNSTLPGCCTASGTCGLREEVIGLGCVPNVVFGVPKSACTR